MLPALMLDFTPLSHNPRLCHKRAGCRALVSPCRWQGADSLVVARQTVDAGLDENEAELGVLVLAVALEVLADGDGLENKSVFLLMPLEVAVRGFRGCVTFLISM